VASLSVVIPAYDAQATVLAAVRSAQAQAQDGFEVEVVVVDDGSRDATVDVARSAGDGVVVLSQANAGPAAARNTGIAAASGDLLAFLDADDELLPGWAAAVAALLDDGAGVAFTDALIVAPPDDRPVGRYSAEVDVPPDAEQAQRIFAENFVISTACLRAKTVRGLGGYDTAFRGVEDWDLWMRVVLEVGPARRDPRPLSLYRRGHASVSSNRLAMAEQAVALLEHHGRRSLPPQVEAARRDALRYRRGHLERVRGDLQLGRRGAGLHYGRAAVLQRDARLLRRATAATVAPSWAARRVRSAAGAP
jgi:glycosyltransferase involved in cell wall biosynthesis